VAEKGSSERDKQSVQQQSSRGHEQGKERAKSRGEQRWAKGDTHVNVEGNSVPVMDAMAWSSRTSNLPGSNSRQQTINAKLCHKGPSASTTK
jgi:hypothetical protein